MMAVGKGNGDIQVETVNAAVYCDGAR